MIQNTPDPDKDPLVAAELILRNVEHEIEVAEQDLKEVRERDRELELKIGTPKGSFLADFPRRVTVAEVIKATIAEKKLDGGVDAFELFFGEKLLMPIDLEIIAFGVKTGDTLLLAATGSGV